MVRNMLRVFSLSLCGLCLLATAARAEWLEASSDHFVIYGSEREKALTEFAGRLERFDAAMGRVYGKERIKPSPSNRVTVFIVDDTAEVRAVTASKIRNLAGIYIPRAGTSVAVIPKLKGASAATQFEMAGETILYHEYAHHFMAGETQRAYPRWFGEGFAEFFAGARFKANGDVELGRAPGHRALELAYGRKVPIRLLLDFDGGVGNAKASYDSFYGQSWVLFHYLQMEPERKGQSRKYRQLLAEGRSALEAAEGAFGDLEKLDKDMDGYMKRRRLGVYVLPQDTLATGPVTVRKLRPAEAAMMPIAIESRVGVSREEAQRLVPDARKVAAQYPDDPMVLAALAEAEFDAGNDDEAIAAADRAVAIDPKQVNAYLQKGYALSRKLRDGKLPKEGWNDLRNQFLKANQIENDHPIPLVQFYSSYLAQGEPPTKNAIDSVEWAMALAPFDRSLRWLVAQQMISDKRFKDAARTLAPLAYSPHPGEHTDKARELLKDVEARMAGANEGS